MRATLLFFAAAAAASAAVAAGPRRAHGVAGLTAAELHPSAVHPRTRAAHARAMAGWRRSAPAAAPGRSVLRPVAFGADPTCGADSTAAFTALTAALPALAVGNLSDGIRDLGGAVVDLDGGCYLLSAPFAIPQFLGNLHIQDGELRATSAFAGAAVLAVGAAACHTPSGQGSCNENVGLHALTIDGAHVAPSCVAIAATMGATLDASSAIFGFSFAGVLLQGGHEAMVEETWVAAYFWSDPKKERNDAVGILINGNDHFVTNVIVFSARDGVVVNGAANLLTNVHTWNCATGVFLRSRARAPANCRALAARAIAPYHRRSALLRLAITVQETAAGALSIPCPRTGSPASTLIIPTLLSSATARSSS